MATSSRATGGCFVGNKSCHAAANCHPPLPTTFFDFFAAARHSPRTLSFFSRHVSAGADKREGLTTTVDENDGFRGCQEKGSNRGKLLQAYLEVQGT